MRRGEEQGEHSHWRMSSLQNQIHSNEKQCGLYNLPVTSFGGFKRLVGSVLLPTSFLYSPQDRQTRNMPRA